MGVQLRPRMLILSRAKINHAFGVGHVTGYTYIVSDSESFLSLLRFYSLLDSFHSHVLARSRHFMKKHIVSKNTFIAVTKWVCREGKNFVFWFGSQFISTLNFTQSGWLILFIPDLSFPANRWVKLPNTLFLYMCFNVIPHKIVGATHSTSSPHALDLTSW